MSRRTSDLCRGGAPDGKTIDPVVPLHRSEGAEPRHLVEKKQTLEDVFVTMVDRRDGADPRPRRTARSAPRAAEEVTMQFLAFLKTRTARP